MGELSLPAGEAARPGYRVQLDTFEGPLDLLLHLIQRNQVDIYDIPVARITAQYLDYLHAMQELDLEVASEFLVMAATLLSIKARLLLPRPPVEEPPPEAEEDPRRELVEKLLEYRAYKEAAAELEKLAAARGQVFPRPVDEDAMRAGLWPENPAEGVTLWDLVGAMRRVLRRLERAGRQEELPRVEVSVVEKMRELQLLLRRRPGGLSFNRLVGRAASRSEAVAIFLALLELVRVGLVRLNQQRPLGDIRVFLRGAEEVRNSYLNSDKS